MYQNLPGFAFIFTVTKSGQWKLFVIIKQRLLYNGKV